MNDKPSTPNNTPLNGVLDEFLNPTHQPQASQSSANHDPSQPYDLAKETSGGGECYSEHGGELRMLDLRQVNGSFTALPYHYLETVDFVPSDGIVLKFPMCKVKITGYRLHAIYRGLLGFRIGYIQALGNHFMPPPPEPPEGLTPGGQMGFDGEDGEPAVEGIAIEMAEGR